MRMVSDRLAVEPGCSRTEAVRQIAPKPGTSPESLRRWHEKPLVEAGHTDAPAEQAQEKTRRLEREVAQLRRASEILKTAPAFFAAEPDRPLRRRPRISTRTKTSSGSSRFAGRRRTTKGHSPRRGVTGQRKLGRVALAACAMRS